MKKLSVALISLILFSFSCSKGPDDLPEPKDIIPAPAKAVLISPLNNDVCNTGNITSNTESAVTFSWNASANSESYDLTYKNLETSASITVSTDKTVASVTLLRNTPYSWYVTAKSTKTTETSASEVWKFYNAGAGITSYAPYQAELLSPIFGEEVSAVNGKISLSWKGTDADNDILNFTVYFGTDANPPLFKSDVTSNSISDIPVESAKTYFWKVITTDRKGNTSGSPVYKFTVK